MTFVHFDSPMSDDLRRQRLYRGDLFVLSPCASSLALIELARGLIGEAFGRVSPLTAQYHMPAQQYAEILGHLKPKFIHHPKSKECIQGIMREVGANVDDTYFDVPRMRSSTSDGYLTTGIAYAWHPHRDTWYSAPQCQINWWLPIFEIDDGNGLNFYPHYWDQPIRNNSEIYNYYQWNKLHRPNAAQYLVEDPRPIPKPTEQVQMEPQICPVVKPGGIIVFAAAHLHGSIPNTSGKTRFSIDFRTVNMADLRSRAGAPNVDAKCTGTALRDFLNCRELSRVPESVVSLYDDETAASGELVYQPHNTF